MKSKKLIIFLTFIPLFLFTSSFYLKSLISPYYLSLDPSPDNEYPYLLNSLNILEFNTPGHTDHPGTPLQILGAIVVALKWLSESLLHTVSPLVVSVLRNPENYLNVFHIVLNLLIASALFLGGYRIFHYSGSIAPALVFQGTLLLFPQILASATTVAPESLLIFAGVMLISAVVPLIFENEHNAGTPPDHKQLAIVTGIALGFGTATKIIFLPLAGLIFLFDKSKERRTALISAFLSFFFFTIPIIQQYPRMVKWFGALLIRKGHYGTGSYGIPAFGSLTTNFSYLISEEPFLFISLVFYLFFSIERQWTRRWLTLRSPDRVQKLLCLGCLIIFVQIAATIKHPGARYLLPAMVFTGLLNSVIIFQTQIKDKQSSSRRVVVLSALFIFLTTGFLLNSLKTQSWINEIEINRKVEEKILSKLKDLGDCIKIEYYRSSLPEYALAFGNDFAGNRFNNQLANIYPDVMFYNMWRGTFYSFKGGVDKSKIQEELTKGRCVVMVGNPVTESYLPYMQKMRLKLISTETNEAVYQLAGID